MQHYPSGQVTANGPPGNYTDRGKCQQHRDPVVLVKDGGFRRDVPPVFAFSHLQLSIRSPLAVAGTTSAKKQAFLTSSPARGPVIPTALSCDIEPLLSRFDGSILPARCTP